jgi:HD superfamily phosphohydrolase
MDYLLRDAYMCGVNYVSFDRQWIINNPYKEEYLLGKSKAEDAGHIWLLRSDGDIAELSTESTIIGSLRNQINRRTRAYIHRYFVKKLKEKGI